MDYEELKNRFTYHPPKADQPKKYEDLRDLCLSVANVINASCPESREKALAITHLEEVVFWANASIARNG